MLYGIGMSDADMQSPGGHQQRLVRRQHLQHALERPGRSGSKRAWTQAGLVGLRFNTIGVSDGISMGTEGMSYSLPSRDLIADSIETVMRAQWYDANISLPGCDKNMPGCLIAMARSTVRP
jgi:dihydroxy-acid dehydratase